MATSIGYEVNIAEVLENELCSICLNPHSEELLEQKVQLACKHIFCKSCVGEWKATGSDSCPLCKKEGLQVIKTTSYIENLSIGSISDEDPRGLEKLYLKVCSSGCKSKETSPTLSDSALMQASDSEEEDARAWSDTASIGSLE